MTSKLLKIFFKKKLCSLPLSLRKGTSATFFKLFKNAMITNMKIHNIYDIIEISKSMEPNKCNNLKKL
jgi:hypothetical protein